MELNIGALISERARLSPDREGFIGEGYRYSFAQVNSRVNQLAAYLAGRGIGFGDRVAVLCKNNEHIGVALFAAAKLGAIAVMLNWRLQGPELEYILGDCGATTLLYDVDFLPVVDGLRAKIPVKNYIRRGGQGPDADYEQALASQPDAEPTLRGGGDDGAVIMYTSGTTGRPKGAVLTHHNLLWQTMAISHTVRWYYDHRFLVVAPLFHIGGLAPVVTNVHEGSTSYFMPEFDPVKVWKVIAEEKITTMMSVPLMVQALYMVAQKMPVDSSSLLNITCGAAAVPKSLIQAFLAMGVRVQQVYGATEVSGSATFWTHEMDPERCDSQGKADFHTQIRIADPASGQTLPTGQVGEIWVKGPIVFKEYWGKPQATAEAKQDGWYRTGDMGRMDDKGYVFVVDRLKDMIISGGENIYPAELEAVIASHPAVAEVAVVGRHDEKWGEIPVAYLALKPEAKLEAKEIFDLCRKNLAAFKCVKEVRFVEALPRNPVGKILKTTLRQMVDA
ncbi:AMP-dependent synthetase and ligase [Desulfarculus baarsii DSM 2075]|uniref:AMP-dependent synthetase and ligase n=1 Tax=Desulfarculus baarsii (strain ATCC 33931 / DSM 2075 / LMG 7858 / VKM B-1802 / 2st14) TaxID=644282 RepID=E1QE92_DESB2|nr:long-chain fatty acid--CoA ligase [Desulfarculus baarsii]ADK83878.1 AMP-dependent synthetase and ligase [Desulfarculus baarsii DSM 2075]